MISGDLEDFIKWDGKSTLSSRQAGTLSAIIEGIHRQGKKVRFWDAPDFKNSWLQLIGAGVDWINTDHIERLAGFLGN